VDVVTGERVDHGGILAGVSKDGGLLERIDARLGREDQEAIPTGEATAGMIRNGGGVAARPLALPPRVLRPSLAAGAGAPASPRSLATASRAVGASPRPSPPEVTRWGARSRWPGAPRPGGR
jgi:Domain of unknown function (DUF4277)